MTLGLQVFFTTSFLFCFVFLSVVLFIFSLSFMSSSDPVNNHINDHLNNVDPDVNLNVFNDGIGHCNYFDPWDFPNNSDRNDISLIHISSRSLNRNVDNFCNLKNSLTHDFSFMAVTETWLPSHSPISLYDISGYSFEHAGRNDMRGGGVGLYVKKSY